MIKWYINEEKIDPGCRFLSQKLKSNALVIILRMYIVVGCKGKLYQLEPQYLKS